MSVPGGCRRVKHSHDLLSFQFDGMFVVSGSLDTSIRVWDAETGRDTDHSVQSRHEFKLIKLIY